ncbi:acyltransferase family protein [Leifsonia sp. NPDC056824]|uniref:acyltransferase family protein n=1 Tax=Leifsonia sp. NPDC056824 TaxID=3345953 RepID=UPI00368044B2
MSEHRYASLDGLRGVAALTVVGYHGLLILPAISALYIAHTNPAVGSPAWWLYATPLRLLFAGHEAVLVFFVLSGFVLTLPFLRHAPTGRSVAAYYPRRIIRLYVPVWGALVFALILALIVVRNPNVGSTWLQTHHTPTVSSFGRDLVLILTTSNLDSPLWSLTWEVWYSLFIPVMFIILRWLRVERWWIPAGLLMIAVSVTARFPAVVHALPAAWLTAGLLQYLPVFVIGMLLAQQRHRFHLSAWWLAPALLAIVTPTVIAPNGIYGIQQAAAYALSLLGVATVVTLAFASAPVEHVLESRFTQWAGKRSFSLYLTHEPIIVAAALATRLDNWWWLAVLAVLIPVILAAAEGFYRVVEAPSIRLSRHVGQMVMNAEKSPSHRPRAVRGGQISEVEPGDAPTPSDPSL